MTTNENEAEPTTGVWDFAEQLFVGVVVLLPAVLWHGGDIGFEFTVVIYLAAMTYLIAMAANEVQKNA